MHFQVENRLCKCFFHETSLPPPELSEHHLHINHQHHSYRHRDQSDYKAMQKQEARSQFIDFIQVIFDFIILLSSINPGTLVLQM